MKLTRANIPENVLRLMQPEARKDLGVQTADEAQEKFVMKSERDLQNQIANFLRMKGIWFDQDAMHKRRTGTKSAPDFQFPYACKYVAWEVKFNGGKLEEGQCEVRDRIISQGGLWYLITNLQQAKECLDRLS